MFKKRQQHWLKIFHNNLHLSLGKNPKLIIWIQKIVNKMENAYADDASDTVQ